MPRETMCSLAQDGVKDHNWLYEVSPHICIKLTTTVLQGFTFYHISYFTTESYRRFVAGFHGSSTELYMNYSRSHSYKTSGNEPWSS